MSAADRIARGRQPDWDIDYTIGHQGELFVASVIDSMADGCRFEVKNDQRAAVTGNFYLEYECRISGQYVPSGFARITPDSSELVSLIVADSVVITAPRELVVAVARKYYQDPANRKSGARDGGNPTHGVIVPFGELIAELMQAARKLLQVTPWPDGGARGHGSHRPARPPPRPHHPLLGAPRMADPPWHRPARPRPLRHHRGPGTRR